MVQINRKKRNIIETSENLEEDILINKIKNIKELEKFFSNKKILKTIYIKNKLINIILS